MSSRVKDFGCRFATAVVTFMFIVSAFGCGGNKSVSGPTPGPETLASSGAVSPAAQPTPTPTPAATAPGAGWASTFFPNAGFDVTNLSGIGQAYRAYITSFDDQSTELAYKESGTVPAGKDFVGSFNTQCVQLDITQDGKGGRPFTFAYFDINGKEFSPGVHPEKTTECRNRCTEPREHKEIPGEFTWNAPILEGKCEQETFPIGVDSVAPLNCHQTGSQDITIDLICSKDTTTTRSLCRNVACPTPPPCVPTYTKRDVVTTTYSDWGSCSIDTGKRSRTKTVTTVTYTLNSCTKQETAGDPVVVKTTEYQDCACTDYTKPTITITGALGITLTSTTYAITAGTVAPTGGTFSPALKSGNLGLGFLFSTTYTKTQTYGPSVLQCSTSASKPFSISVPAGECFYNVKHDNEQQCKAIQGASWNSQNHLCDVPFPGISDSDFNLNPGQSALLCLDKH